MRACPGCGQTPIPVVELQPRPVPEVGQVLFAATVPDDALDPDTAQDLVEAVHAVAEGAAPGRNTVVLLGPGMSLDMLPDDQLAALGLQRRQA